MIFTSSEDNISELSANPQKCGGVCITHLNCCSVLPHKEEVFNLLYDAQIDVMALIKTWLDDTII